MKRIYICLTALLLGSLLGSCAEEKLNPTSVFTDPVKRDGNFDKYLYREYTAPYNIEVKYWLDDKETDKSYQLTPARQESAQIMAVLVKHLWLDAYAEVAPNGVGFLKQYATRIIQFIGSTGVNANNTEVLGTAEGGKKMTLYKVNALNINNPASYASALLLAEKGTFQVIHHEFAHILHQTKNYSESFQQISIENYVRGDWNNYGEAEGLGLGFITTYARQNADEDFVEIFSMYVTMSQTDWNARVARGGANGTTIINQKLAIVKNYFKNSWGMDLDQLRDAVQRRANEISELEFSDLK